MKLRFISLLLAAVLLLVPAAQAVAVELVLEDGTVVYIPDEQADIIFGEANGDKAAGGEADDEQVDFFDEELVGDEQDILECGYTEAELYLAAQLIYAEGASQSDEAFEAMASVVYNRLKSKKFPGTVEGVVFQANQFTVTRDKEKFLAKVPNDAAKKAIYKVFVDKKGRLPASVMYFRASRLGKKWGKRVYYKTIGGNHYYS